MVVGPVPLLRFSAYALRMCGPSVRLWVVYGLEHGVKESLSIAQKISASWVVLNSKVGAASGLTIDGCVVIAIRGSPKA